MCAVEKYIIPWQITVSILFPTLTFAYAYYHHDLHTEHSSAVVRPICNPSLHELLQPTTKLDRTVPTGVFTYRCTRLSPGDTCKTTTT